MVPIDLCAFHLLLLAAHIQLSVQDKFGSEGTDTQNICAGLWDGANATGVEELVVKDPRNGALVTATNSMGQWKVSVRSNYSSQTIESASSTGNESYPDAVANIWLDPFDGVDLNNGENGFSACAWIIKAIPENTNLRGQDDDTTCTQMLSRDCVNDLNSRAETVAQWMVENPTLGPYSNLTPPILAPICSQIESGLGLWSEDSAPKSCRPYFFTGNQQSQDNADHEYPILNQLVLTDNVTKPTNCSFYPRFSPYGHVIVQGDWNAPPGNQLPYNGKSPAESYDRLVDQVWPILTVQMPPANVSRQASIGSAFSKMTCIRASNITQGGRVPPSLPKAKAVQVPHSSSYWVVRVGVPVIIIGVLLVGLLVWWCVRRTKRANRKMAARDLPKDGGSEEVLSPQKDGAEVYQLAGKRGPAEVDDTHKVEMGAGEVPRWAKGSEGKPQEMLGSVPSHEKA